MKVAIKVKAYRHSKTRSYFPEPQFINHKLTTEKLALCRQDGFIIQKESPSRKWGIITLADATERPGAVLMKIGYYGKEIILCIARSRLKNKLVTGRFTSNFQLDVEFRDTPACKVDRLIARAISKAFEVRAAVVE